MNKPSFAAESLLAIDVGAIHTRASLFDVVDGRYRFLAAGVSPSTATAPFIDVSEGVRRALVHLQTITGRQLFGTDERLIIPSEAEGRGVDACVATISAGPPLKIVAVGLLEDISAESARRLAKSIYSQVIDFISLNDRRKPAARLDSVLRLRPDVIIVAGGTEGGASQSVLSQIEAVGLACYLMPQNSRPELLYAGNQALVPEIETSLSSMAHLSIAPNIRPSLEMEQLGPAQAELSEIYRRIRMRIHGVEELDQWTGGRLMPTSAAFGRILRFLSRVYDPAKGVLGVDVGASATTLGAAFSGELVLGVYPELGLGEHLSDFLTQGSVNDVLRWIPGESSRTNLLNYVHNKALYPGLIPATAEAQAIEQALARQAMQWAINRLSPQFPAKATRSSSSTLPWFEPIFATGSVITRAANRGQSLLLLLDGLQPTGVSTVVIDQNNILATLGAVASMNSTIPIQLLESNTFLNLGTVISPVGNAPYGSPALRVRITQEGGPEKTVEVKSGGLEIIPIPMGQPVNLHLQPFNRFDVGMGGPGRGGGVRVVGGALGVIIDARGRPLRLPPDTGKRTELLKKWAWILGGSTS